MEDSKKTMAADGWQLTVDRWELSIPVDSYQYQLTADNWQLTAINTSWQLTANNTSWQLTAINTSSELAAVNFDMPDVRLAKSKHFSLFNPTVVDTLKDFMRLTPGDNVKKLFTAVSYNFCYKLEHLYPASFSGLV